MRILIILLLAALLPNAKATSLPDGPKVGQAAPVLKLPVWLQAPPEAAQGWPTGKVVVLEFWATTCGPCVADIPDLNALADQFKDKPVQFIAVTDDQESAIKRFLKRKPIHAWIGLGPDAGFGERNPYRVASIPHTVIIDAHGRIAAITDPFLLNSSMIQSCLDGLPGRLAGEKMSGTNKVVTVEEHWESSGGQLPGLVPGQYEMGIKPSFQVMIRPTPTNLMSSPPPGKNNSTATWNLTHSRPVETWINGRALTAQNDSLKRAIEIAFNVKPLRIVAETKLPEGKYDFYITLPVINKHYKNQAAFETVFAQGVAATFGLTVKRETRDVDVLVLKTNATSLEALSRSVNPGGKYSAYCNEAAATNQPLSSLAEELEISSKRLVFDETGLTNDYDFDIKWKQKDYAHPNIAGMTGAVRTLGLNLVPEKKSLEVVVVSQTN
jgi:uncharacterized protein (TIGR03435 family)